jgi:transcriptional regulator with XRE-family HTH domain
MWIPPEQHKVVGSVLAAARKHHGLTQVEMAQRLDKPQSFVSAYEQGQRRVDVLELIEIAKAMGENASDLFASICAKI